MAGDGTFLHGERISREVSGAGKEVSHGTFKGKIK